MNGIMQAIFNNPKTTITAVVSAIAYIVAIFGFQMDATIQNHFVFAILFIYGCLSADGDK